MSDFERSDVFAELAELARRYPHWRIGQLVANVAGWADTEIWDAEDGQLLAAAREHLGKLPGPRGSSSTSELHSNSALVGASTTGSL